MSIDDVIRNFERYQREFPAAVKKGLAKAGMAALNDAVMSAPKVPKDEGTLRGSGSVFVDNSLVGTSEKLGSGGTPNTQHSEQSAADMITATVGFNTPYAAYLHEGQRKDGSHVVQNYHEAGTGKKYLINKLVENRDKYMAIVAKTVKDEMDKLGGG